MREVLSVPPSRWQEAQACESSGWVKKNRRNWFGKVVEKFLKALVLNPRLFLQYVRFRDYYRGDDWNFWWMDHFEHYAALPKKMERALEVGCGPYTNMRLISKLCDIEEIHCADPLIGAYCSFRWTWLARQAAQNGVILSADAGEQLHYADGHFDLVVCINVLDHVQDAARCLAEAARVTKPGGFLVLGQDLSDSADIKRRRAGYDAGRPICVRHATLEALLDPLYAACLRKVLPREAGRAPDSHYGTYLLIGQKRGADAPDCGEGS